MASRLKRGRVALVAASVLLIIIGGVITLWVSANWRREAYIERIREQAIADVQTRAANKEWVEAQIPASSSAENWRMANFMLFENGEWLVHFSQCSKEDTNSPGPYNIFIAKGSDGKWYHSSYHFCVDMLILDMEERPASIAAFALAYAAEEFDGTAAACSAKTWPREDVYRRGSGADVLVAEGSDGEWRRVRILAFGKVYELDNVAIRKLQGFSPGNSVMFTGDYQVEYLFVEEKKRGKLVVAVHKEQGLEIREPRE